MREFEFIHSSLLDIKRSVSNNLDKRQTNNTSNYFSEEQRFEIKVGEGRRHTPPPGSPRGGSCSTVVGLFPRLARYESQRSRAPSELHS